jgi:hypothetical protein
MLSFLAYCMFITLVSILCYNFSMLSFLLSWLDVSIFCLGVIILLPFYVIILDASFLLSFDVIFLGSYNVCNHFMLSYWDKLHWVSLYNVMVSPTEPPWLRSEAFRAPW